jgi:hypothetical protein
MSHFLYQQIGEIQKREQPGYVKQAKKKKSEKDENGNKCLQEKKHTRRMICPQEKF